jgi:hypothetical protein
VTLYASTGGDNGAGGGLLYRIDTVAETVEFVGDTGLTRLGGIDFNGAGLLYGVDGGAVGPSGLFIIDPNTAEVTFVGPLDVAPGVPRVDGVDALRFDAEGSLFGGGWDVIAQVGRLARIDVETGVVVSAQTHSGVPTPFTAGLAFSRDGVLYGSRGNAQSRTEDLVILNRETGALGSVGAATNVISDIWFNSDGTLYGGSPNGDLFTIDPATGAKTLLFNTGVRISGLTGVRDVDSDGDGVPDSLDNCPLVANPDQAEGSTPTGPGRACENECPGPNCIQPAAETIVVPAVDKQPGEAVLVTATFRNDFGDIVTIRPDCVNTTFTVTDGANLLSPIVREKIYGTPDDLVTIPAGATFSVTCDLAEMFDPTILTGPTAGTAKTYQVLATYSNHIVDPTGTTSVWTGAVTSPPAEIKIKGTPLAKADIDIEPFIFPNVWPCALKLTIPVAILSTEDFDATKVDPKTVTFGKLGTEALDPTRALIPGSKRLLDVNKDGRPDMLFAFWFHQTGFSCNDIPAGTNAVVVKPVLKGKAKSGTQTVDFVRSDDLRLKRFEFGRDDD